MTGERSIQRFEVENFLFFAHAVPVPVSVCGCAIQKSYFLLAFVFARTKSTVYRVDICY